MQGITKVSLDRVTKRFFEVRALREVSLDIAPGDVVAVMGANGAGKSTLLRLLALLARPTRGRIAFNGEPSDNIKEELRQRIGFLSHDPLVYPDLTARENLVFFARLSRVDHPLARVEELIGALDLTEFANARPTRVLSRGQLQRVSLARALVAAPDLLLLDEPAAGLDQRAVRRIRKVIVSLRERGGMAVVVTHEPDLAAAVATRALMLHRGRVVLDEASPAGSEGWRRRYLEAVGATG
jgi:heme exporter protein A